MTSTSYTPSTPFILAPLGRLFCFLYRPPVASSGDIWDIPSLDKESKNKNKNKGKSKGKDKDKDKDKDEDKDKDKNKNKNKNEDSTPASKLR